jgi:hypothetical protein
MDQEKWNQICAIPSRQWTCGHCNRETGTNKGYVYFPGGHAQNVRYIYICPVCGQPTYFDVDRQIPGASYGNMVSNLPATVGPIYDEARNCMIASATTGAVMLCRKILMHISAEKGASAGLTFKQYVDYLVTTNIVPAQMKPWVNHIRDKGNEANHELVMMSRKDAEDIISFTEMLLKIVYEYPEIAATAAASGT